MSLKSIRIINGVLNQSLKLLDLQKTKLGGAQILRTITCHKSSHNRFVNKEPGHEGTRDGKPDQIGEM